jgi:serine/threonine protein kinase
MDLWTEFEGVTIDSAYALKKLIQTQGRSAFFSTTNANGESVLIRIIECHFDEDEILARWRGVQTLGHPSFLRIDHFGQFLIEADNITAVYAVFERADANLGQVLERGRLSPADAAQIGLSMASALETLHAHGFVHEHIEPQNIFAVGESVRLRSDCIRETPEGDAGLAARCRDVHDLSVTLMQVLLGQPRRTQETRQTPLPPPFDDIVRNGMSGEWGLAEIQAALAAFKGGKASKPRIPIARVVEAASADSRVPSFSPNVSEPHRRTPALSGGMAHSVFSRRQGSRSETLFSAATFRNLPLRGIAAAVLLLLVVLFGWMFLHRLVSGGTPAAAHPAANQPATPLAHTPPGPRQPASSKSGLAPRPAASRADWRVVAFTYNREDQARKKASTLSQKHPDLHPDVFSPNGRAPWLVTIGGAMDRDAAYAFARNARSAGLPHDTYAQNYTAR